MHFVRSAAAALCLAATAQMIAPQVLAEDATPYEQWKKDQPDAAKDWLDSMKKVEPEKTEEELIDEYNKQNTPSAPAGQDSSG